MLRSLHIALIEVKLYLQDKGDLAFSLLLPIATFALIYGAFGGQSMFEATAYIIDEDDGIYSEIFLEKLEETEGITILYTTHYMDEADRLCDRVAIIDGGKLITLDTPRKLKEQIGPPEQVTLEDVFLKWTGRSLRD